MKQYENITTFADIPAFNGKSLKNLLMYQGTSYWWFVSLLIFLDFHLENYNNLNRMKSLHLLFSKHFIFILWLIDLFCYIIYQSINKIYPNKQINIINKYTVLFNTAPGRWITKVDNTNGIEQMHSMYYDDIFEVLDDNIAVKTIYDGIPVLSTFQKYTDVRKIYHYPSSSLMDYWSWNVWREEKEAINHYKDIYQIILENNDWIEIVSKLSGLSIDSIKRKMEYHCYCTLPLAVRYHALSQNLISVEKPDVLVLTSEHGYFGRILLQLGKKSHIPTIGLQHGIILPDDRGYMTHTYADVSAPSERAIPLPDYTLVWSQIEYDLLVNKAYIPRDRVVIIGNPRYDKLAHVSESYSKDDFCQRNRIDSNQKLILWTTQSHGHEKEENIQYIREVFTAISSLKNAILIVKPHPLERDEHINVMKEYAKKFAINILFTAKDSDTTEQIYVSDLLINKDSTTGQEAVALHKPMIVLDFSLNPDAGHFVSEGVAIGVYEKDILKSTILKLLNNDFDLEKNRAAYIDKYMYKIDGKAAERCANFIHSVLVNAQR